ncbi:unnamed protein product [Durusdinium trenchii]|uniref:DUF4220 domain-containing protein n=1 Tax=Durusdinium trenchii TaxID=1381693 RepID=A0ABP0QQT7_9DINO
MALRKASGEAQSSSRRQRSAVSSDRSGGTRRGTRRLTRRLMRRSRAAALAEGSGEAVVEDDGSSPVGPGKTVSFAGSQADQDEADEDDEADDEVDEIRKMSSMALLRRRMAMPSQSAAQLVQDLQNATSFSILEHLVLALLGGLSGARRSWRAARESAREGSYLICFLYALLLTFGRLMLLVLPLALLGLGVTFVVKEGPTLEDIDEITQAPGKLTYSLVLITSIIGAASISFILGPPRLRDDTGATSHTGNWRKCLAKAGRTSFTLYLLFSTLWTWGHELKQLHEIAQKQKTSSSPLLRTLMLTMVQTATSSQWGRYVDQFALLMVFNDYLNFKAAHQRDFLDEWECYMRKVKNAKEEGKHLMRRAMVTRPFSDATMDKAFARSMLDTPRLVALIQEASKTNGYLWTVYMVVLLARCWTFGWVTGLVYFPLFFCCYPWVLVIILLCMIVLRLILVEPLMKMLIYRKNQGDAAETDDAGLNGPGDGPDKNEAFDHPDPEIGNAALHGGSQQRTRTRTSILTSVHPDGTTTTYPRLRDEKDLKTLASAMALTGFGPGHCDRAMPYLLYTTWYSERHNSKQLRESYEREVQTLCATGITRDGWCYIVMYAAVGKVMMDMIVVVMSRLLVA